MSIIEERLTLLESLTLESGAHDSWEKGACIMEAVAYVAGERFSDHPKCASPVLGAFLRSLNDRLSDEKRQLLKPFIPRLVGTNTGAADDEVRRWMLTDWLVHEYAPAMFRAAGLTDQAESFERLAAITGPAEWREARETIYRVRDEARERRRAAAAAAAAAADADAVADAAAAAAADADADADAVADAAAAAAAAADADAVADAAAAAAADAAAAAAADAVAAADVYKRAAKAAAEATGGYWEKRRAAYDVFYPYYRDRYDAMFEELGLEKSVLQLVERLIAVGQEETVAA